VSSSFVSSRRKLAIHFHVSEKAVRLWLAREDWPVGREPPWGEGDLAAIRSWRESLQEDRAAETAEATIGGVGRAERINTLLKFERMLDTRVKRRQREGQLVERSILDRGLEALSRRFVDCLDDCERTLPLRCAGQDPGQIERTVRQMFHEVRERLASQQIIELRALDEAVRRQTLPAARGRPAAAERPRRARGR
jgi:hypothetical protein